MPNIEPAEQKPETIQFRLEIPAALHHELKMASLKTGIPISRIIMDGAKFRCNDIFKLFKLEEDGYYRNK